MIYCFASHAQKVARETRSIYRKKPDARFLFFFVQAEIACIDTEEGGRVVLWVKLE